MIGMDFVSFLILLVIALIVAAILHFVLSVRVIPGWGSYASKVAVGWVGGWLGSPVLGHWWDPVRYEQVYIIPAIVGCAGAIIVVVDFFQTMRAVKAD